MRITDNHLDYLNKMFLEVKGKDVYDTYFEQTWYMSKMKFLMSFQKELKLRKEKFIIGEFQETDI